MQRRNGDIQNPEPVKANRWKRFEGVTVQIPGTENDRCKTQFVQETCQFSLGQAYTDVNILLTSASGPIVWIHPSIMHNACSAITLPKTVSSIKYLQNLQHWQMCKCPRVNVGDFVESKIPTER